MTFIFPNSWDDFNGNSPAKMMVLIGIPSGNLLHGYWTWPIEIVDLPIDSMVIFHSFLYVYQRVNNYKLYNVNSNYMIYVNKWYVNNYMIYYMIYYMNYYMIMSYFHFATTFH